ncbi:MAG: hypothetical protein IIA54_08135 [Chloroflexi bacterium]|nr:hypothetical protein [Chloroflexota bacterium]
MTFDELQELIEPSGMTLEEAGDGQYRLVTSGGWTLHEGDADMIEGWALMRLPKRERNPCQDSRGWRLDFMEDAGDAWLGALRGLVDQAVDAWADVDGLEDGAFVIIGSVSGAGLVELREVEGMELTETGTEWTLDYTELQRVRVY